MTLTRRTTKRPNQPPLPSIPEITIQHCNNLTDIQLTSLSPRNSPYTSATAIQNARSTPSFPISSRCNSKTPVDEPTENTGVVSSNVSSRGGLVAAREMPKGGRSTGVGGVPSGGSGLSENELVCVGALFLSARSALENRPSVAEVVAVGWACGERIKCEMTRRGLARRSSLVCTVFGDGGGGTAARGGVGAGG